MRAGMTPLVRLPTAVARVHGAREDADREHGVGVALHCAGVAATRPIAPVVVVGAHAVVFWNWLPTDQRPVSWRDVGHAAAQLHDRTRRPAGFGGVVGRIRQRLCLAHAAGLAAPEVTALLGALLDARELELDAIGPDPLGTSIVHGDLHSNNVVLRDGTPHLVDLEMSGDGPRSFDLVPVVVAVERYGAPPSAIAEFEAGYGAALPEWEGIEVLQRLYELWLTTWALTARRRGAEAEHEAEVRLRLWTAGVETRWQLL
jgi:Ser/Thr protein kinase RdoA (MazF antagonist)